MKLRALSSRSVHGAVRAAERESATPSCCWSHDRPRGLLALVQPGGSQSAPQYNYLINRRPPPPPPRNASNNLYWMNGGYIFTSRSIKITLCQLLLAFFWTACLCFLTQSGSKVVEMLHSDELVFYSGGVFKTLFQGTFGAGHCVSHLLLYFISLRYKWHITSSLPF